MNRFQNFLWWLSGADREILTDDLCRQDRKIYTAEGILFVGTVTLSFLSGSFAFYTIFFVLSYAIFFGLLWAIIVASLERYLGMLWERYDGPKPLKLLFALSSLFFSMSLGVIVSQPLTWKIFEVEIKELIVEDHYKNSRYAIDLQSKKNDLISLQKRYDDLDMRIRTANEEIIKEVNGSGGTGIPGRGDTFDLKTAQRNKLEAQQNDLSIKISALNTAIQKSTNEVSININPDVITPLTRAVTLSRLTSPNDNNPNYKSSRLIIISVTLILAIVESAPLLAKLLIQPSDIYSKKKAAFKRSVLTQINNENSFLDHYNERKNDVHQKFFTENFELIENQITQSFMQSFSKALNSETTQANMANLEKIIEDDIFDKNIYKLKTIQYNSSLSERLYKKIDNRNLSNNSSPDEVHGTIRKKSSRRNSHIDSAFINISLFGIQRAGKTTFLARLIQYLSTSNTVNLSTLNSQTSGFFSQTMPLLDEGRFPPSTQKTELYSFEFTYNSFNYKFSINDHLSNPQIVDDLSIIDSDKRADINNRNIMDFVDNSQSVIFLLDSTSNQKLNESKKLVNQVLEYLVKNTNNDLNSIIFCFCLSKCDNENLWREIAGNGRYREYKTQPSELYKSMISDMLSDTLSKYQNFLSDSNTIYLPISSIGRIKTKYGYENAVYANEKDTTFFYASDNPKPFKVFSLIHQIFNKYLTLQS